ncbi:hypothetical protein BDZ45DRAFT_802013 [Acephala macrosclerotiorum]|nr:hypothetical protein BDZ45DRAFT_802013 [Acephala macrosclerotiorum]
MATNSIKHGLWTDYNRFAINSERAIDPIHSAISYSFPAGYQILLSDWWAGILTNTIAVLITSVGGPMFILTIGPYNWLWRRISSRWTNVQSAALEDAQDLQERTDIVLQNLPNGGFVNIALGGRAAPHRKRDTIEVLGTRVLDSNAL